MTLLSEILSGAKRIWSAISGEVEHSAQAIAKDPIFTSAAGELLTDVKQGASNAIMFADTALAPELAKLARVVEVGLEAYLAAVTKGASIGLNPAIDATVDTGVNIVTAAAQAAALKAKAKAALTTPATSQAAAHAV